MEKRDKNRTKNFVIKTPFIVLVISVLAILAFLFIIKATASESGANVKKEGEVDCKCAGDTINFVKQKIEKLLSESHQIAINTRKKEVQCINGLLKNAEFLIIETTEAGDNYHQLDQYIEKENNRIFHVDTIKILASKDRLNFKIMGRSEEIKPSKEAPKSEKVTKKTIPTAFQGKIRGSTRRINIISQITEGDIVEFSYKILGSHTEKNKKGNINFISNEAFFETFGKGKIVQNKNEMTIKFETSGIEIKSINQ
jgi:hypothetical protein